jgi:fatty-acyl-CoA synthase
MPAPPRSRCSVDRSPDANRSFALAAIKPEACYNRCKDVDPIQGRSAETHVREGQNTANAAWLRALERTAPIADNPNRIFPVIVEQLGEKFADKSALLCDRHGLSFADLSARANQYARWAIERGVKKGDVICLNMPNCAEYLAVWIGITSIGSVVALLNTNLVGQSLAHCLNSVRPKHVIVASELTDQLTTALPFLQRTSVWSHGGSAAGFPQIDHELQRYPGSRLADNERRRVTLDDLALYIYTSGTTGLPKAARIPHRRIMQWSHWFAGLMDTQPDDRMYNCLPLYHSVGGIVATGAVLINGGSVVIRDKFSTQRFWNEVSEWDCTLFQYIGELCRYLVKAPAHHRERAHRLRLCCGNGLRGDVWNEFRNRFRIPAILEFYASTEGNVSLYNVEGHSGSIGRIPPFLRHRSNLALVKFDVETNLPARSDSGFCIRCKANEDGEAIGRIYSGGTTPEARFDGYYDREDTEEKIARNVFEEGDAWFRTGDLLRMDEGGYFYFVDRIGDTFRWKGENVSTVEVSQALSGYLGVVDAAAYGVTVAGHDGRAGMAALVVNSAFKLAGLVRYMDSRLPRYAQPMFLRLCATIDTTATFKHQKRRLIEQGYNPDAAGGEPIYFKDPRQREFVLLDGESYSNIQNGLLRF